MATIAERYQGPADLPQPPPVFPLRGAILLPRAMLPLNMFEPRYLAMLDDVMSTLARAPHRAAGRPARANRRPASRSPLRRVGCVGRVTTYQELDDGRLAISLTGVARCTLAERGGHRQALSHLQRRASSASSPTSCRAGEDEVDRQALAHRAQGLPRGPPDARRLVGDLQGLATRWLVNSLAIVAPYGPEEKQALLEAPDLKARAEVLVALAEMELAAGAGGLGLHPAVRLEEHGRRAAKPAADAAEVEPRLLEILVCPRTKTSLVYDKARQELISRAARLAYPIREGIPIMLEDEARPLEEEELRALGRR